MSYVQLAETTLSSNVQSVTFSSIPQNYKDLIAIYHGETTNSGNYDIGLKLNNTSSKRLWSTIVNSSTATSYSASADYFWNLTSDVRTIMHVEVYDYSDTNKASSAFVRLGSAQSSNGAGFATLTFPNTNVTTSLTFIIGAGTFISGSTFKLFGLEG